MQCCPWYSRLNEFRFCSKEIFGHLSQRKLESWEQVSASESVGEIQLSRLFMFARERFWV